MTPTPVFDYVDEFPSSWQAMLTALVEAGHRQVCIPIRWGAHETAPGIRDFSRSPRLRLEKLFQILQTLDLRATVQFGFSAHSEMFPLWARSLGEKNTIPTRAIYPDSALFGLAQAPDIYDPAFIEPFWSFVGEAMELISLYRAPDGPVETLHFEPGVFTASFPGENSKVWERCLQQRYGDIARLNAVYGATLKDFASATSRFGAASLAEKRPWICAFDYHSYRQTLLADLKWAGGRAGLTVPESSPKTATSDWSVFVDATFAVPFGLQVVPVALLGAATESGARSFQTLQSVETLAAEAKLCAHYLLPGEPLVLSSALSIFLTGKYLSKSHHTKLMESLEGGREALFLYGLPQYDEQLTPLWWPKRTRSREGLSLCELGTGKLWVREFAGGEQPELQQEIENSVRSVRSSGTSARPA